MANVNRRWLVRTGTLSAGVLLIAALLGIVNYFGWKYHKRFDWTASRLYTLSEKSKNVVRDLKRDVEFVVFLAAQRRALRARARDASQYDAASQRVRVRYVDPRRNRWRPSGSIQQYGIPAPAWSWSAARTGASSPAATWPRSTSPACRWARRRR